MRLSLAAIIASICLMLPSAGTTPAQASIIPSVSKGSSTKAHAHKHFKLYVRKHHGKHYHFVHTYKSAKEAHKAAHKFHKRGYKTKIRTA